MKRYKELLVKLKKTGFFSIFLSSVFSKVIVFFGGILIVRVLSQGDYAKYTLVLNAFSLLCIFGDFGASSASLQFMTEEEQKNNNKSETYFSYGLKVAMIAGLIAGALILLSDWFYPFKNQEIANLTKLLCMIPFLTYPSGLFSSLLRSKQQNNRFSLLQILSSFIHYAVIIPLILIWSLIGALVAQYCYTLFILIAAIIISKKYIKFRCKPTDITKEEKKKFLKLSFASQINSSLSNLLYTIDIFLIGVLITSSNDLAIYKVSTIIPSALAFLPYCFIIYIFPYFIINNQSKNWLSINLKRILKYGSIIYGIITLLLICSSYYLVLFLYGKEYLASVLPFNILLIGFFFEAVFTMPSANIIYSQKKVKINILINVLAIIVNFILDVIFILVMGYIGVAVATVLVKFITAMVSLRYVKIEIKKLS